MPTHIITEEEIGPTASERIEAGDVLEVWRDDDGVRKARSLRPPKDHEFTHSGTAHRAGFPSAHFEERALRLVRRGDEWIDEFGRRWGVDGGEPRSGQNWLMVQGVRKLPNANGQPQTDTAPHP